jgi:hypothetical protein
MMALMRRAPGSIGGTAPAFAAEGNTPIRRADDGQCGTATLTVGDFVALRLSPREEQALALYASGLLLKGVADWGRRPGHRKLLFRLREGPRARRSCGCG